MAFAFSEAARRLLDGRNYAVLATVNSGGSPQTPVMWAGRDGGRASAISAGNLQGSAAGP